MNIHPLRVTNIFITILLSSCVAQKEVTINRQHLIGKWELVGKGPTYVANREMGIILELNENNTCSFEFYGSYNLIHTGTYRYDGKTITLTTTNGASTSIDTYEILSFQNEKMEVNARQGNPLRKSQIETMLWQRVTKQ